MVFLDGEIGTQKCEVRFDGREIVISFFDGDYGEALWKGEEKSRGHYELRREEGHGVASLHKFDKGFFMDGYWEEDDENGVRSEGMLRISLKDPVAVKMKK